MLEENVKPESIPFLVTDSLVFLLLTVRHRRSMKNYILLLMKCYVMLNAFILLQCQS